MEIYYCLALLILFFGFFLSQGSPQSARTIDTSNRKDVMVGEEAKTGII